MDLILKGKSHSLSKEEVPVIEEALWTFQNHTCNIITFPEFF